MSAPWEDYADTAGPWNDYRKNEVRAAVKEGMQEAINDPQGVSWVVDSLRGVQHGSARLVDNLENMIRSSDAWLSQQVGLGNGAYQPLNWTRQTIAPVTMTGKVFSYAPDLAFAIATAGGGEALAAKALLEGGANTLTRRLAARAVTNAAGSVGWQAADSGEVGGIQTAADIVLGEGVSHLPKVWRLTRQMIGGSGLSPSIVRLLGNASIKPKAEIVDAAERVGVKLLPSTLTQSAAILSIEDVLSKIPGSAGMLRDAQHGRDKAIGVFTDNILSNTGRTGETTGLGADIRRGIESWVKDFKAESTELYNKVWEKIPRNTVADTPATREFIAEMDRKFVTNPALKKALDDKRLAAIYSAIKGEKIHDAELEELQDLIYSLTGEMGAKFNPSRLSFDDVKHLRTLVGESIKNPNMLAPNMLEGERRALYGALSGDLERMVNRVGAGNEWEAAVRHYEQGTDLINKYLQDIINKKDNDAIYTALFGSHGKEPLALGAEHAKTLLNTLPEVVRGQVIGEIVYRMGKPKSGAATDGFNMASFATRYHNLTEEARRALFTAEQRASLDALEVLAQAEKAMSGLKNHSNTGAFTAALHTLGRLTNDPVGGALSMAVNFGGSKAVARLIMDEQFAKWLTQPVEVGVEDVLMKHFGKLVAMYHTREELRNDISFMVEEEAAKE
ncbi:hypothetical protein [Buttiauxella brennerae]|uniref:hypothetical protein n=1 Tax=Buttiauxella brennerae TaxID=82988 RepID=UPI00286F0B10|nr:hypothetical protein [Buttiauxella brennerae]